MSDQPRRCCDCDGEGGWTDRRLVPSYVRSDGVIVLAYFVPIRWNWCKACHGLGWRSKAADAWFYAHELAVIA